MPTEKSIDQLMCISVNDVFVMDAWGKVHTHFFSHACTLLSKFFTVCL
jgi:peroxiredoxin